MDVDRLLDEAFERLLAAGGPHGDAVGDYSLSECQALISWRLLLYRNLIKEGWQPPPPVVARMAADEELLWLQDDGEQLDGSSAAASRDAAHTSGRAARADAVAGRLRARLARADGPAGRDHGGAGSLEQEVAELEDSLGEHSVVERARGMLMLVHRCGEEEAFRLLVRTAHHGHLSLREAAQVIVDTATRSAAATAPAR